ncbi:acyloxyacyl hydrolase [Cyclobacterium jeungdonense]|uniref:Acyloxyacyl hydrolase n=1 Tax=Cyclobacterium jeungdonense TaxID=708087 RepID=A0ABT8CBP3_9BACT|nr:acyloxyacyl hydrolase [Cyclobacterium jeungdonense]MDN3689936.1 acyloxyacyl hydrolase [Cyclobacterium jeungdonense]
MRHVRWIGLLILIGIALGANVIGQTLSKVSLEGQNSWIIPHSAELVPISQSSPRGFRISYEKLSLEKSSWENCNCFYLWGGELGFTDFNNSRVLGNAFLLSGFFEPILWQNHPWRVGLRTKLGISYLSNVYDPDTNPENTFFSSNISFLLSVAPKLSYNLSDTWELFLSGHYNHISNGGQKQPNRGMNFPGIGIGASYWLSKSEFPFFEKPPLSHHFSVILETISTMRDNPEGKGRVPAMGASVDVVHSLSRLNSLGAGAELFWDQSLKSAYGNQRLIPAVFLSHHLIFGRVDFNQRMGFYLVESKKIGQKRRFFQRYGLTYRFPTGFLLGADLKAHGHVAENIGLRLGWVF